jgi:hypothetical protein
VKVILIAILIMLVGISVFGFQDKKRDWQEGKLTDISTAPFTEGTIGGPARKEKIVYTVDAGKYVYTFSHLHFPHDKAMPVTVNAVVKFAIEKSKVYLLDEDDKEHDLKFEKKALKETK